MFGELLRVVRKISQDRAKVVGFCPGMASFIHLTFAPAERGGRAGLKLKVSEEAEKSGRPLDEVADEVSTLTWTWCTAF